MLGPFRFREKTTKLKKRISLTKVTVAMVENLSPMVAPKTSSCRLAIRETLLDGKLSRIFAHMS